jgi:flagellin-like hook-associated protein FlgL
MYDTTMHYLQRNGNALHKLQEQISSEKMINRPSDNPVGFTNALNYRNIINALGQQRTNMDDGEIYMGILETTHQSINNIFVRNQELAVQASSDTTNHPGRLFINMEVRQNLEHLVSLAQSKHKDNYIFSGKWTNQPPYEIKNGIAEYRFNADNQAIFTNNYDPSDPDSLRPFQGVGPVTIQIYDSGYFDPNIKPIPDHPLAQRIIPGSLQLAGNLLETPHRRTNEGLAEDHPDYLPEDHPDYNKPDYEVDYVNGTITLLSERAKEAFYNDDGSTKDAVPGMTFEYIYRNSIDMSGEIYREIDTGITMKINTNPDDLFGKPGAGDTDSFKEIIAFMQGLWHNDQPQISQSIDRLNDGRERNLEHQAVEGARLNRLGIVYDRNYELNIANTDAKSRIEDVDLADALTKFSMADAVYNASLQAAARLMQRSLMDYI